MASSGTQAYLSTGFILGNDLDGINLDYNSLQADPMFVDPEHGDFHLLAQRVNGSLIASPGIDAFTAAAGARQLASVNNGDVDVDSRPGAQDIDGVGLAAASGNNVYDLGAYEMQPYADRIFADGFGEPLRLAY